MRNDSGVTLAPKNFDWSGLEQKPISPSQTPTEDQGFWQTARKAIVPGVVDPLLNLGKKVEDIFDPSIASIVSLTGGPDPRQAPKIENYLPKSFVNTPEQIAQHPVGNFLGNLMGYVVPGTGEVKAASQIPELARLAELSKSSSLARILNMGTHGAIQGGAYSPPGHSLSGAVTGGITGAGLGTVVSVAKGAPGAYKFLKNMINPERLSTEEAQAQAEMEKAQEDLASQKQNVNDAAASTTTNSAKFENQLRDKNQKINDLQSHFDSIVDPISSPHLDSVFDAMEPSEKLNQAKDLVDSTDIDEDIAHQAQKNNMEVGTTFGPGLTHTSAAATGIKNSIQAIRDSFKPEFNDLNASAKNKWINAPTSNEVNVNNNLLQNIEEGLGDKYLEEHPEIGEALSSGNLKLSGDKFIELFRAIRNATAVSKMKANNTTLPELDRQSWRKKYNQLSPINNAYQKTFETEFPEDIQDKFNEINDRYSTQVTPFYRSKYYSGIMNDTHIPENFIDKISGNEDHQLIYQNLIQSNPELSRLLLGQKYFNNPKGLLDQNPVDEPYVRRQPTILRTREQQITASGNAQGAKNLYNYAKKIYPKQQAVKNERAQTLNKINNLKDEYSEAIKSHRKYQDEKEKEISQAKTLEEKVKLWKEKKKENDDFLKKKNNIMIRAVQKGIKWGTVGLIMHEMDKYL